MITGYTSSDIVTDSTTIITNVGVPKIVTGSSRADIYIGISTNALCQINLSLHDNYFSSGGTCQVERLTSQQNMYALYLSIPNYYYSSGQEEFRTWNFAMTATTCDNGLEKTTEFSIKQLGCASTCTITWKNYDDTTLDTDSVQIGTMPSYSGPRPTKESTAQYDYVHTGWTPTIVVASVDTAYTATFSAVTRTYTILWKNYNGNTLEIDENVPYGDTPSYDGATPTRPGDSQHTYEFTGWSPATATVTGDQTYTAQFREESVEYIITWDINGSQETSSYHYNDIPSHSTPQPYRDETYEYTFDTWRPAIVPVTENKTYTAVYSREHISYYVTWIINGVSERQQYYYGVTPSHSTPQPYRDETYEYTFDSWNPDIVPVTGDAEYTAIFSREHISYYVTWEMDDGEVIQRQQYFYGDTPSHQAPSKPATAQYTYTFAGWNPPITIVTGDKTYTATFTSTVNNYVITWNNWDGSRLKQETLAYGSTPVYTGTTPTRPGDSQHTYNFTGWSPDITTVTENKTYTAQYEEIVYHTVTFNMNGKSATPASIPTQSVLHAHKATEPNPAPVADDSEYSFINWKYTNEGNWYAWDFNDGVYENITLYANWEYQSCRMIMYVTWGDSDIESANRGYYGQGVSYESKTFHDGQHYGIIECTGGCITDLDSKCGFSGTSEVMEVIVPDTLVRIGEDTFDYSDLTKANLVNVQYVGAHSFEGCDFYAIIIDDGTTTAKNKINNYNETGGCLVISTALTVAEQGAFYENNNLIEVELPGSLRIISSDLLKECPKLKKVTIKNGPTSINERAFEDDYSLSAITIPSSVKSIGYKAFNDCVDLTISVPTSVTAISNEAFTRVANVVYNGSATWDEDDKWWGARSLNGYTNGNFVFNTSSKTELRACLARATGEVTIPSTVTKIGDYAFYRCNKLEGDLVISNSVTTIGDYAFYGSTINYIHLSTNITSIGDYAFGNCIELTEVRIYDLSKWCSISFGGTGASPFYERNATLFLGNSDDMVIDLIIPSGVRTINDYAFYGCSSYESITIPSSVTSIGTGTFNSNCGRTLTYIKCYATTPPTIDNFYNTFCVDVNTPLLVPSSAISAYRSHAEWGRFRNISAI